MTGRSPVPSSDPAGLIDSGVVVAVRFEGNEEISDPELSTIVATRKANWFKKFIGKIIPSLGESEQYADRVVLDADVQSIEMYYKHNGFLEADAEYDQRFNVEDLTHWIEVFNRNRVTVRQNRVPLPRVRDTIIFWISEGPAYTITRVAFVGLESLPEEFQPELTERNTIRSGERWSAGIANGEVARLRGILQENGYPFFKKDTIEVIADPQTKTVRVIPYLNPGNRYRFGGFRIEYDTTQETSRVSESVILGQLIDIDSGEWYKESVVREAEQYLYRLNVFELASISLDTSVVEGIPQHMRDSMALPVRVRLRMKGTRELTPGFYVGTGSIVGLAAGLTLGYIDRNILGGAQRLDLDLFYQHFPRWQPRYSAGATLSIPYMGWRNFPLSIGANSTYTREFNQERTDELRYTDINHRLRFASTIVIGGFDSRTSVSPEFTAEYVDQLQYKEDKDDGTIDTIVTQQVNAILATYGQWDRSDDPLNPTRGFILNGGAEFGMPWLSGLVDKFTSASYWKNTIQGRLYDDLGTTGAFVLASKIRIGDTYLFDPDDPSQEPPRERRFFGGGSSSNRGWNSKELLISNDPDAITTEGGFRVLEASLEFRIAPFRLEAGSGENLVSPLRIAVFSDAGNVWDNDVKIAINQTAWTVGLGLRYNIFIGALRVDWGFKFYDPNPGLNDKYPAAPGDTKGRWITERRILYDDTSTLHFGIGHAF